MKINRTLVSLAACWCVLVGPARPASAAEAKEKPAAAGAPGEQLVFHTDWKGERIALPPTFAPAMKVKGVEVIRFAPGMFQAQSESFFSYAFVFSLVKEQPLTKEIIQREMLVYYQGLAESVSKSKGRTVDAGKFTFELEQAKQATGTPEQMPAATKVTQYAGKLAWVEPFVTGQPQTLHFEIQFWTDSGTARDYLFVCTSPKVPGGTEAIWRELRNLRRSFEFQAKPTK